MDFFVPKIDGDGPMPPDEAEDAWLACRKGAERDTGQEALARRVYRLAYRHNGREMSAQVGELEPYYDRERVMAIVAFAGHYKVCCAVRGYLKIGDTPIVGGESVDEVEDFVLTDWPPTA
jgi:hypothetical protein